MMDPVSTAAVGWGFSAAGWLISPVLTRFFNKCLDALGNPFESRKKTLFEKLDKLKTTLLPQLLILTDAAQQSPHRPALEDWLLKLKSAFYEAQHLLGLIEYQLLEKKVNSLFPSCSKFNAKNLKNKLPIFSSKKKNLIKSLENLEKIVTEGIDFVNILNLPSSRTDHNLPWRPNERHAETISTPGSTVIGRNKDRDDIVKLLRKDSSESTSNAPCYSIIAIWGIAGAGKTTLAQYVCEYEKEAKHFDCIIWAHVSQKFSVHAILEMIWESAFKEACPTFRSLEGLQSKLEEKLRGQMFFLVLDDVWCDKGVNENELEQLFAPLRAGKRGSKILVTTRIEEAAKVLGAMNPIPLRELNEDEFFSLLMSNALGDAQIRDKHMIDKLTLIGKKIAAKLRRSPLAAKTIAGQLRRNLDPEFWSSILKANLLNDTMGALFLSYQHLSFPLQRCFAFCSLYPKGRLFEDDHLVNLWIAEGFIETEDTNEHMKDIANRYILELVSCSFFQVDRISKGYFMHDLLHDLAQHVSEGECFRIESDEQKEIPTKTRHLYIVADMFGKYVEKICQLKDVCTIVVFPRFFTCLNEVDLDAVFMKLRKLYVVDLQHIESLPKSVIYLKNLRYLSILEIKQGDEIPESINRLYQLRVLRIRKGLLLIKGNQMEIPDVGRLILLQDLGGFIVKKRKGFELKQLQHLTELSGSLSIYDLHNVESEEETTQAKLSEKKGLKKLVLSWNYGREDVLRDIDIKILDGLCPPPQIKVLVIEGYSGKRLPSWILENNGNIQYVDCKGLQALQRMNELPDLQSLTISHLPRLKSWVPLPLNLTRFEISHCLSLAFALKEDLEMITSVKSTQISRILTFLNNFIRPSYNYHHLSVGYQFECVKYMIKLGEHIDEKALSTISNDLKGCLEKKLDLICQFKDINGELFLPPTLDELTIESCFITDKVLAGSLQGLNSLTDLTLCDIITITCITDVVLCCLSNLRVLCIRDCLLVMSVSGWDTHSTLERLVVGCCPNLTLKASVVANSCNTAEQTSSSCKGKTAFSLLNYISFDACMPSDDSFRNLLSLVSLCITYCPIIGNPYIGYLKSLVHLTLDVCPNLISLRGLSELSCLKELKLIGCQKFECYSDTDKLTYLEKLTVNRFCQLEQLMSRDGFSSLESLELYNAEEEYFSQQECEVLCYLSSLVTIYFNFCKMRMLPNLTALHTLRYVYIYCCKNLTSLSELPPSVKRFSIEHCNENFTRSCRDPKNSNWQKISHIPEKKLLDF